MVNQPVIIHLIHRLLLLKESQEYSCDIFNLRLFCVHVDRCRTIFIIFFYNVIHRVWINLFINKFVNKTRKRYPVDNFLCFTQYDMNLTKFPQNL